jgi:NTE family protein
MMNKYIYILLFCLFIFSSKLYPQKVGLVLSGGGAKGLAHIGVIKALEENHIPIDYITGTSMGAIIGGLYASGYSTDEMEMLFKSEDFKLWSTGVIPTKYIYYFKKLDDNPSFLDLDFAKKEDKLKLSLPTSLIPSGQMDFAFMQLYSPANALGNEDFDKLFVPFRCVATDIYRNEQVVLRKGDLGNAIRASMTFPFYFKPIEINNVLLFDGGLVNNFPVDVMTEDFHPDIIIGSAVDFKDKKPNSDDLLLQIENIMTRKTNYKVPDSLGITIKSPVDHIALLDFDLFDESEKTGYESAMAMMDEIKSRISLRSDPDKLTKEREEYRSKCPTLLFNNIKVSGTNPLQGQYIIQSILHRAKVIDLDDLRLEYFKILGDDKIKSLQPSAHYNKETGYFDLSLKAEPQRTLAVGVGGYFSLTDVNEGYLGFKYRLFNKQPITFQSNINFGKLYTSFLIGSRFDFPTKTPFSTELYYTKSRLNYFSGSSELFFEDKRPSYVIRNENNIRLDFSLPAGTNSKWELGINYLNQDDEYYQTNIYSKADTPDQTTFNAGNLHARYEEKALNKKQYPTEGKSFKLEAMYLFGKESEIPGSTNPGSLPFHKDHQYLSYHLNYERYFQSSKWLTLGLELDSYFSTKELFHNYTSTIISANVFSPTVQSSMRYTPSLRSNNFAAGGLKAIIPISASTHIRLEGYYYQPFQEILSDENNKPYYSSNLFTSNQFVGSGGLVIHTPLGPATLLLNLYSQGDPKFFLQASFGYLLFNRRAN